MQGTNRSIVAGVFTDEAQAQKAMSDLENSGFTEDQIRYSVHKGGSGITDSLMGLGLPKQEADFYNGEFMQGRTIVTVKTNDRQQEVASILSRNGGYDASNRMGQTSGTATTAARDTDYATTGDQKVQLRSEELTATKQRVQAGEVDIHKEVVSEQQTLNVPVQREEVYIERTAVTNATPSDTPIGQDETIRVPVSEEQVNVQKQTVVRDEFNVGKRGVQENQQVSDTVRHEELRVDKQGDIDVEGTSDNDSTRYNR